MFLCSYLRLFDLFPIRLHSSILTLTVCTSLFSMSSCVLVSMIQPSFLLSLSYKQPVDLLSLGIFIFYKYLCFWDYHVLLVCLFVFPFIVFFVCFCFWRGCWIWNLESFGLRSCLTSFSHDRKADIKITSVIWFPLMCARRLFN